MKTAIEHSCGHRATVQLYGTNTHGERDRKAAWLATQSCPDCAKVDRAEQRDERNQETAAQADANDWPTLNGTDRQIPWATTIRADTIAAMAKRLNRHPDADIATRALAVWTDDALRHTDASWWIDNRTNAVRAVTANLTPESRENLRTLDGK